MNTSKTIPVLTVVAVLFVIWYVAAVFLNTPFIRDQAERAGTPPPSFSEIIPETMRQDRPVLPAPHQVAVEIWKTTGAMALAGRPFSKRSLIYHAWITLSATLLGFLIGTALGVSRWRWASSTTGRWTSPSCHGSSPARRFPFWPSRR